jgi:hypothetical protein
VQGGYFGLGFGVMLGKVLGYVGKDVSFEVGSKNKL